jgi:hypothetical protein
LQGLADLKPMEPTKNKAKYPLTKHLDMLMT